MSQKCFCSCSTHKHKHTSRQRPLTLWRLKYLKLYPFTKRERESCFIFDTWIRENLPKMTVLIMDHSLHWITILKIEHWIYHFEALNQGPWYTAWSVMRTKYVAWPWWWLCSSGQRAPLLLWPLFYFFCYFLTESKLQLTAGFKLGSLE